MISHLRMMGAVKRSWLLLAILAGCKSDPDPAAFRRQSATPAFPSRAILKEPTGGGEIEYLGVDIVPDAPGPGESITLKHYFRAKRATAKSYDIFVHGEVPSGPRVLVADHTPMLGRLPTDHWKVGEIYVDEQRAFVPTDAPAGPIDLWLGLFSEKTRWLVEAPPGGSDGRDRIKAATIRVGGEVKDDLPIATIARADGPITIDGKLDDPAWKKAEILETKDSMGRDTPTRFPTKLRLLWDDQNLYVGFEATDQDITERFKERDDPIYDHETVEVFIMPNVIAPALGPYVELQASPGGIIFDASFDGPRKNMNKAYEAGQTIATTIDGTLNGDEPDKGWVSEWAVPFAKIRGVSAAPKAGDEWRMNAFRIEKWREGGQLQGEFTAWSPPKVGDFHNVLRFGRMRFDGPR